MTEPHEDNWWADFDSFMTATDTVCPASYFKRSPPRWYTQVVS